MERLLIGKVEIGKTKAGRPVAHLYSTDTRLQFPVLTLFDLSALTTIGLDPAAIGPDGEIRRFWAYYTESEKTTSRGNPYRDIQYLEPVNQPATATSVDTSALLAELREIKGMLRAVLPSEASPAVDDLCPKCDSRPCVCELLGTVVDAITGELPTDQALTYGDGSQVGDNHAEQQAYIAYFAATRTAPESLAALRAWATQTGWTPETERA
jgi:hypothetical protein